MDGRATRGCHRAAQEGHARPCRYFFILVICDGYRRKFDLFFIHLRWFQRESGSYFAHPAAVVFRECVSIYGNESTYKAIKNLESVFCILTFGEFCNINFVF